MAITQLAENDIVNRLDALPDWCLQEGKLCRSIKFQDFSAAFAFMTRVAMVAEQMNHHPHWSNVYNRVDIALTTHDADGISELDFELAGRIELLLC